MMAGKFMSIKKITISILTLIIVLSQVTGCSIFGSNEMVNMINNGKSITIEIAEISPEINDRSQQQEEVTWVELDKLKTFNDGFRQDFDNLFNINIISENGIPGKSGCLFVGEDSRRNGNTTLEDSLRNRVFVNDYWIKAELRNEIAALASKAYTDVDGGSDLKLMASLNAYYNLLPDSNEFNGNMSLTREEFYALVFRSEEGVQEIEIDADFEAAIGGSTALSKFAQGVAGYGFLQVDNKSLDSPNYRSSISRAEAIYLMVNKHFKEELEEITGKEKAFSDNKNGGNLALKVGFKEKVNGEIKEKDRFQAYTLAYMVQNTNKGMQDELYRAMVVAKDLGLFTGENSRWDEPITKAEAIELVVNTHLTKNDLYGYLTDVEYGQMATHNVGKVGNGETITDEVTGEEKSILGKDENGFRFGDNWTEIPAGMEPIDGNKVLDNGFKIGDVKILLESFIKDYRSWGTPEEEIEKIITEAAIEYGTTVEELERVWIRDEDVEAVGDMIEEERQANINKGSSGNKGSSNKGSSNSGNKTDGGNKGDSGGGKKEESIHGTPGVISDAFKDNWFNPENLPSEYDGGDTGVLN